MEVSGDIGLDAEFDGVMKCLHLFLKHFWKQLYKSPKVN